MADSEMNFRTVKVKNHDVEMSGLVDLVKKIENASCNSKEVVLDISEVDYLNSASVGAIMHTYHKLCIGGKSLVLVGPSGNSERVLTETGLSSVINLYPSFEDYNSKSRRIV